MAALSRTAKQCSLFQEGSQPAALYSLAWRVLLPLCTSSEVSRLRHYTRARVPTLNHCTVLAAYTTTVGCHLTGESAWNKFERWAATPSRLWFHGISMNARLGCISGIETLTLSSFSAWPLS